MNSSNSFFVLSAAKYDSHITLVFLLDFWTEIVAWYAFRGRPDIAIYEKYSLGFHPTTCSSTSEPSLNEINLLRKNPDAYADNLVDLVECYNGLEFKYPGSDKTFTTKEGVNALEDAIEYLQTCQKSFPPLTLVDGLCKSANYLCEQNGPTGSLSTTCADGFVKITIYFINLYLFLIF